MKHLLHDSLLSLVTGLAFGLGLLGAFGCYKLALHAFRPVVVQNPGGFVFPSSRRVPGQARFTVEGILENTGETEWESAEVVVDIYAGAALMTYCRNTVKGIGAGRRKPFVLACRITEGRNIPDNVSYRLKVAKAMERNAD